MERIDVNFNYTKYPVIISSNSLKELEKYKGKYDKILVISDRNIGSFHKEYFLNIVKEYTGIDSEYFELISGEEYKNINTVEQIYDYMLVKKFSRKSLILTLGGGVVCDIGGYVAATFMRGIDFIQVPTSLLATVDASVGGKVAVNHNSYKNVIGAFYQPKAVLINLDFLETLPRVEYLSGLGEVIKHSLISSDDTMLQYIESNIEKIRSRDRVVVKELISLSVKIKRDIVVADEKESLGIREFLNLGHTYAHALETIYKLKDITHGEAVIKGIIYEMHLAYLHLAHKESLASSTEKENILKEMKILDTLRVRIEKLADNLGIDFALTVFQDGVMENLMTFDKKNSSDKINFVILKNFGIFEMLSIDLPTLKRLNSTIYKSGIPKRFIRSVIDIGTNSARLFISEVERKGNIKKIKKSLYKETVITGLGRGVDGSKVLSDDRINYTLNTLESFYKTSCLYGAVEIDAFATSATRDASNREYFMDKIRKIGINIACISGETEAKLSFIGISSVYEDENICIVDIGGGSTEISFGRGENIDFIHSYNVGSVRATELFFREDNYCDENIEKFKAWVEEETTNLVEYLNEKNKYNRNFILFGVAGSVTSNVSVALSLYKYSSEKVNGFVLSRKQLNYNLKKFLSVSEEERTHIVGLEPKRGKYIVAGTLILLEFMRILGKDEIVVSEIDNLEGATIYF